MQLLAEPALTAWPWGLLASLGFILGAVVGSYMGTVLWRWPRGESANRGRSRCEGCSRTLRWHEIIPLAGFMLTRGRCGACGHAIGAQHFILELACALLGALCFAAGAPWLSVLAWLLVLLGWFDARYLWLPDRIVALTAIAAIAIPPFVPLTLTERLIGGALGFGLLWVVAAGYRRLRGRDGLGGGDAKLLGAIGLWTGPFNLPLVLLAACGVGLADAALRIAQGADAASVKLPLGTYLAIACVGAIIVYCARNLGLSLP